MSEQVYVRCPEFCKQDKIQLIMCLVSSAITSLYASSALEQFSRMPPRARHRSRCGDAAANNVDVATCSPIPAHQGQAAELSAKALSLPQSPRALPIRSSWWAGDEGRETAEVGRLVHCTFLMSLKTISCPASHCLLGLPLLSTPRP